MYVYMYVCMYICTMYVYNVYTYSVGLKSANTKYDSTEETTMDTAVANPFSILSAYLMTAATMRPPKA